MIFNNLNFAGVNSIDYGIYITGEAVYNVPERSVEFVSIAGRDGDLILDNGHFENIEVTYPAGCFGVDQTSFADKVRAFRNAIASKKGYQRLTDSYNPNEYRMATFVNGVEVDPTSYGRAGEFELLFNCQPFRYLMSGESEIEVTSGSKIANPTPFESKPLIEVEGYGTLNIGEYEIELENVVVGNVELLPASRSGVNTGTLDFTNATSIVDNGDTITLEGFTVGLKVSSNSSTYSKTEFSAYTIPTQEIPASTTVTHTRETERRIALAVQFSEMTFSKGSGDMSYRNRYDITLVLRSSSSSLTKSLRFDVVVDIENSTRYTLSIKRNNNDIPSGSTGVTVTGAYTEVKPMTADSTLTVLGHPTYIDCDIGQAYKESDGELISLDAYIDLGSDLPVLDAGENEITFDNTITDLKIIPRWRQI